MKINMESLRGGLIVSCQAYPGEPMFGSDTMAKLALAAKEGGAVGIRANSPADIAEIKRQSGLPIIGIWKRRYPESPVYITPTLEDAKAVALAGADIIALDATMRPRPGQELLGDIVSHLRTHHNCLLMADVATVEEGLAAERLGFDIVSTTLSGYTGEGTPQEGPDFQLVSELSRLLSLPVFAEGRISTPEQAREMLSRGAHTVVVGTAITRPEIITRKFVGSMQPLRNA